MTPLSRPAIRLLALDIDGTLIGSDGMLRPRTIAAVEAAIAAGVRVALATGRMTSSALSFADQLGIREPIIGLQGAAIREMPADVDGRRGRLLYHRPLDAATTREAVAWCRGVGLVAHLNHLETMYFDQADGRMDAWSRWLPSRVRIVADVTTWALGPVSKVIAVGPPGLPELVADDARARFAGRAKPVVSHPEFLEFIAPGVSKGRALRWLARRTGVPLAATMAIGDQMNDLEMISEAGFGVAMPHAPAELIAAAEVIAPPLAEEGAAQVIETFVLGGRRPRAGCPGPRANREPGATGEAGRAERGPVGENGPATDAGRRGDGPARKEDG